VFNPMARSSVLFPDMFDPVTRRIAPGGPTATSLLTRRAGAMRGWPSASAAKTRSSAIVGTHQSGLSRCAAASADSASSSPIASSHPRTRGPAMPRHASRANRTWKSHSVSA
jgi:hypothetical protein